MFNGRKTAGQRVGTSPTWANINPNSPQMLLVKGQYDFESWRRVEIKRRKGPNLSVSYDGRRVGQNSDHPPPHPLKKKQAKSKIALLRKAYSLSAADMS